MADSTVKVNFLGDASSLKRATDESEGHLSRLSSGVAGFAKVAAVGFAAASGGALLFAKSALDAARESEKVDAQTKAVIKSTGAAAHVTVKQVGDLATAISNKTGIDDEAIQSGQNLLLTFTELQNRAGKGNDIFNQATQVMVDMSTAMGQDASSTAIQLGKALNDPTKGLTALTRVGVTFDAAQKKQIETMQKAGDVAGAQKIILAELTKEFGGSAAAQATSAQKMKVAFGNLQEKIGMMLIPVVEKLSVFLTERVVPVMSILAEKVAPKLAAVFNYVRTAIASFLEAFSSQHTAGMWEAHGKMESLGVMAAKVFGWLKDNVPPILAAIGKFIREQVIPAIQALQEWVEVKLVPALSKMAASFREEIWPIIEEKVLPALQKLAIFIRDEVLPILGKIVVFIVAELIPAFFKIVNWISTVLIPKIAEVTVRFWQFAVDVKETVQGVVETFVSIAEAIFAPFKFAFNEIAKLWNSTVGGLSFSIPGWVPGIGGHGWDVPDIPVLHQGGTFRSSTPGGEGLALLKDGETVSPAGMGANLIIQIGEQEFARVSMDVVRRAMAGAR